MASRCSSHFLYALLAESEFTVKCLIKGGLRGRLESGRNKCLLIFARQGYKDEQIAFQNQGKPRWSLNFDGKWCCFDAWMVLVSVLVTANVTWLCMFWEVLGIWGLSAFVTYWFWIPILKVAKNRNRERNINIRWFLIFTCVCSNALLKIPPLACMILFSKPAGLLWGSALCVTVFSPPARLCFCTCWVQSFSTCASNPGSIGATVRVRMSYCTSRRLCQRAAPGLQGRGQQKKRFLHNLLFRPKPRSGPLSPCAAASHPNPSAPSLPLWGLCREKGSRGPAIGMTLSRGAVRSPAALHLALFLFSTATSIYTLHWKRGKN